MKVLVRVGQGLAEAFWTNWRFLSQGFDEPPEGRNVVASELSELIARDLPILIHKRNKWSDGDEGGRSRWLADLEGFVSRSLRPQLAGESLLALWNDGALARSLDALVAHEQQLIAVKDSRSLPVTCRFDSHWAT
jgi:hypothetical protein